MEAHQAGTERLIQILLSLEEAHNETIAITFEYDADQSVTNMDTLEDTAQTELGGATETKKTKGNAGTGQEIKVGGKKIVIVAKAVEKQRETPEVSKKDQQAYQDKKRLDLMKEIQERQQSEVFKIITVSVNDPKK